MSGYYQSSRPDYYDHSGGSSFKPSSQSAVRPLPTPAASTSNDGRMLSSGSGTSHTTAKPPYSSHGTRPYSAGDGGAPASGPSSRRPSAGVPESSRERDHLFQRDGSSGLSRASPNPPQTHSAFRMDSNQPPPRPPVAPTGYPSASTLMSPGASSSSSSGSSFRSPITSPPPQRAPLPEGSIVVATSDLESLVVVPLGGRTSPEAIRETIMGKLHIADDDFFRYKLFLTSIGSNSNKENLGRPVGDEDLWDVCRKGMRPGQVLFAHSVISSRRPSSIREDEDLPAGMSAERMRQMGKDRPRTRDREREGSNSSGAAASPIVGNGSGVPHRRESPTINVRSAEGDPRDKRSPGSLRSDNPSWAWSGSKGDGHARRSSAGGLSPPRRETAGSTTPTGVVSSLEDRPRHDGEWVQSPPLRSAGGSSSSSGPSSSQQVVMGPSGPTRRLPPQPPTSQRETSDRLRAQTSPNPGEQSWSRGYPADQSTASSSSTTPQPSRSASAAPQVAPPPTLTRPLASSDPRVALPQYQPWAPSPTSSTSSSNVFHNIALQQGGQYPSFSSQPHLSPNPNGSRAAMMSKSVDNLRGQYVVSPGPPIPPQVPPQYRGTVASRPQPPSQPAKQPSFPPVFDPRVMNAPLPPATSAASSPATSFYRTPINAPTSAYSAYSMLGHPPPLPPPHHPSTSPSPHTSHTSVPQQFQHGPPPPPPRRVGDGRAPPQAPRMPDMSKRIDLNPGETLQSVTYSGDNLARPRRTSDAGLLQATTGYSSGGGGSDFGPALDGYSRDRHGQSLPMRRVGSAGQSQLVEQHNHPAVPLPVNLRAGYGRERDSGSSFASVRSDIMSSSPSTSAATSSPSRGPPPSASPSDDSDAYGGMRDEGDQPPQRHPRRSNFTSPPSSARSSASGPLTPASDPSAPPQVAVGGLDEFGDPIDDDGGATWFPVNQPAKAATSRAAETLPVDDETSTTKAHEWAEAVMQRINGNTDSESTLMRTLQPGTEGQDGRSSTPRVVDEFGDDLDDDSTYFPGFGPARPVITTDAPSASNTPLASPSTTPALASDLSRSPGSDRQKRPSLRLRIEDQPSTPKGKQQSSSDNKASPPSSSAGRRAAAAGEPGDLTSNLSSRRNNRSRAAAPSSTDSLMALGQRSSSSSPKNNPRRRSSFRAREEEQDWAIRPAVETVLENLDVFFPDVDLDKPVFDLPTPAPSTPSPSRETSKDDSATSSGSSSTVVTPSSAHAMHPLTSLSSPRRSFSPATHDQGLGHKKSIRVVAQDRKRAMQRAGRNVVSAVSGLGSNLLRRKSTKLFGARIEEVTSAQMGKLNSTIKEIPDDDPDNFSYKWIKGDLIGRGTFGHVYIGFSVNTGETIAVKQVELPRSQHDKEDVRTKTMVQSLKAEIELLKDLDHPNIVLYLGMEETREHLSIFLEYVPGGSIGRIVRTHGKFEENVIKYFTAQILEGLEYLHSLGILHRDMKADNILTDHDGMCKISDFGTSKKSADIYNNNENMSMQGSIFWMAPEVIHNKNQGYSAKADIWSLGCILIEMFAGRRPWSDEEAIQAMFKLGAERLAPPVPADVSLSDEADSFLKDCLQIDSNLRPKAIQLQEHPFLLLDEGWSFTQTSLYRVMASEEARRRTITAPPVSAHST